jgi:ribosome-associated heat shock protein Hsp15
MADALTTTRVDRWLCAVRLHATRSAAAAACEGGHVRVNDKPAKPATPVRVGDQVRTRSGQRERIVEVVRVIDKRVGAAVAAECLIDHSPPELPTEFVPQIFVRDRGTGRPTKRDRRTLDKLRGDTN